jgi:hypothetical protein
MRIIRNAKFRILPPQPAELSGVTDLELAQQAAKAGNGIVHAAMAQGVPHDRLLRDQNTLDYCYSETGPSARSVCARLARQP